MKLRHHFTLFVSSVKSFLFCNIFDGIFAGAKLINFGDETTLWSKFVNWIKLSIKFCSHDVIYIRLFKTDGNFWGETMLEFQKLVEDIS